MAASEGAAGAAAAGRSSPAAAAAAPGRRHRGLRTRTETVVLLFVRDGGIDDRLVAGAIRSLGALPGVATFVVPAERIARYAAITQGVDVNRVPALVVLRPEAPRPRHPDRLGQLRLPEPGRASSRPSIDAGYKGRTLDYHP